MSLSIPPSIAYTYLHLHKYIYILIYIYIYTYIICMYIAMYTYALDVVPRIIMFVSSLEPLPTSHLKEP